MEKKTVVITFVPDEAVKSFAVTLKQFNKGKLLSLQKSKVETPRKVRVESTSQRTPRESALKAKRRLANLSQNGNPAADVPPSSSDDDENTEEECILRRKEYGGEDDRAEEKAPVMFGFQTPKRQTKLTLNTPQCVRQEDDCDDGGNTSKSNIDGTPKAKHSVKKRGAASLRKNLADTSDSEDDSDFCDEESVEEEEESGSEDDEVDAPNQIEAAKTSKSTTAKTSFRKKLQLNEEESTNKDSTEDYFLAQTSSVNTSDRTLNRLKNPRLAPEEVSTLLSNLTTGHQREKNRLVEDYCSLFSYWNFIMREGFNVLVYGLGSKRLLLEEFRTCVLKDACVLVINGFFPGLTLKEILNSISVDILEHRGNFSSPMDQLEFIESEMRRDASEPIYIVVHNIDGPCLQSQREQDYLCRLAAVPNIHLIASIDHINAALIWDQQKLTKFSWVYFDCTTFASYFEEISYENSLLVQQSANLAASSLARVFASLTSNAKAIFLLIAKNQLENKENSSYPGLPFHELYQTCRDDFLVNSDLTLRAQLTEFKDHKLLRMRRTPDGTEVLVIPLDKTALDEFVTKYEEENNL